MYSCSFLSFIYLFIYFLVSLFNYLFMNLLIGPLVYLFISSFINHVLYSFFLNYFVHKIIWLYSRFQKNHSFLLKKLFYDFFLYLDENGGFTDFMRLLSTVIYSLTVSDIHCFRYQKFYAKKIIRTFYSYFFFLS